eukprot:s6959_g1.t1
MHLFALRKIYSRSLPESKSLGERDREGALDLATMEVFAFGILLGAAFTLATCSVLGLAPTSPGGGGRGGGRGGGAGREEKEGREGGGGGKETGGGGGEGVEAASVLGPVDASESAVMMSMVREPPMEDDELPTMLTMLGDHDTDLGVAQVEWVEQDVLDVVEREVEVQKQVDVRVVEVDVVVAPGVVVSEALLAAE